jgi:hypothetical protein
VFTGTNTCEDEHNSSEKIPDEWNPHRQDRENIKTCKTASLLQKADVNIALRTKCNLFDLNTQFVPRSKHISVAY